MSAGTFAYIKLHNMTEQVGGLEICLSLEPQQDKIK